MPHAFHPSRCLLIASLLAALAACEDAPPWDAASSSGQPAGTPIAAPPPAAEPRAPETPEMALADFLAAENIAETPMHRDARVDLDGDGRKDLLMFLEDRNWCGSGGCTLLVFHLGRTGYELITRANPVQPPIAVSPRVHAGWRDLLVGVGGGGTVGGTVALQFNGSGYPDDPTLLALLAPEALPPTQAVID